MTYTARINAFTDPNLIAESVLFSYIFAFDCPEIDPRGNYYPGQRHQSYQLDESLYRFFDLHGHRDVLDFHYWDD